MIQVETTEIELQIEFLLELMIELIVLISIEADPQKFKFHECEVSLKLQW